MIRRTMDAERLNVIANDPEIRPLLGGVGELDLTEILSCPANFALETEAGGFVFHCLERAQYEMHTLLTRAARGAKALELAAEALRYMFTQTDCVEIVTKVLELAAEALRYMFTQTDCVEIVTKVPATNKPADFMARRVGFRQTFVRRRAWDGETDLSFFVMNLDDWRGRDALVAIRGHDFHEMLAAAKFVAGSELPIHPDDEAHDRAAGASCMMAAAGQAHKAVWSYSRWARMAGYQTIELLGDAPPVIDVRDAILTVRGGELEILKCR